MGFLFQAIRKVLKSPRSLHNKKTQPYPGSGRTILMTRDVLVPKGHFAVYVGEITKHRFVVPISYLKHALFQDLLRQSEEEYGFDHPSSCISIPCSEKAFLDVTSRVKALQRK